MMLENALIVTFAYTWGLHQVLIDLLSIWKCFNSFDFFIFKIKFEEKKNAFFMPSLGYFIYLFAAELISYCMHHNNKGKTCYISLIYPYNHHFNFMFLFWSFLIHRFVRFSCLNKGKRIFLIKPKVIKRKWPYLFLHSVYLDIPFFYIHYCIYCTW